MNAQAKDASGFGKSAGGEDEELDVGSGPFPTEPRKAGAAGV